MKNTCRIWFNTSHESTKTNYKTISKQDTNMSIIYWLFCSYKHWNRKVVMLMTFSSHGCIAVCHPIMKKSSTGRPFHFSDSNWIKVAHPIWIMYVSEMGPYQWVRSHLIIIHGMMNMATTLCVVRWLIAYKVRDGNTELEMKSAINIRGFISLR